MGVHIHKIPEGTFELSWETLINSILVDLHLDQEPTTSKRTPAKIGQVLRLHEESPEYNGYFHYQSAIGKFNFLEKVTCPDISYATHQCARFSTNPWMEHHRAVKWLGRDLKRIASQKMIYTPKHHDGTRVYVDANFEGVWYKGAPQDDRRAARFRYGYIIMYTGMRLRWVSKLQTRIALSSAKNKYIGISEGTRHVIPIMELLQELKEAGFKHQPSDVRFLKTTVGQWRWQPCTSDDHTPNTLQPSTTTSRFM